MNYHRCGILEAALTTLVVCLTANDLLNSNCNVLCKRDGYNGGYHQKACVCFDSKGSVEDLINRRVNLGKIDPLVVAPFRKESDPTYSRPTYDRLLKPQDYDLDFESN